MQQLLKQLEVLTQMMREYAERQPFRPNLCIKMWDDGIGSIEDEDGGIEFEFTSLPELIDKLKK